MFHDADITFIGHSKGGAEAAANAIATNKNAILFNPATVALSEYNLNDENYIGNMTAYIVEGEILNSIFKYISEPIDNVKYLSYPDGNMFDKHSIKTVIKALGGK